MAPETIGRILVPVDGSATALRAAEYAVMLAKQFDATLLLLHVVTIPQFPRYFKSIREYYGQARKEAETWFDAVRKLSQGELKITGRVITGATSIVESVVEYAEMEDVDMIVIGTRGRSKFKKLMLGSVGGGVVAHAKCPVLVVK